MSFAQPDNTTSPHWGGNRDIQRDRWGRPLVVPPDGGKPVGYTRCTTFVDALSDQSNLTAWKARMVAKGLTLREDLWMRAGSLDPDLDKAEMGHIVEDAAQAAGSSRAADIGTQLHEATERHDLGQDIGPIGTYKRHLDAYINATRNITWHAIEQFRVCDELQIGGTADRVALIDGSLVIADIKTGGLWDVGKMAQQLAVYAHSVPYNPQTGQREADPYPVNTEMGLLIHLQEKTGECDLYWLNLTIGWEGVQLSARVRQWRQFHKNKATRGNILAPVAPDTNLGA